ncbi:MAG: hypothetical protein ACP5MD_00795 [Verrucomicrobiia bacterium]
METTIRIVDRRQDKSQAAQRPSRVATARQPTSPWEREIDQHVYRLYSLTPEEIKIVEEGVKQ